MKTRPERVPQQTVQYVYSIPCEYGRSYISETGRPLAVRLHEHKNNLREGLLGKSKLAQHAYEEGHTVGREEARILEKEINCRYGKYKESAHIACLTNPISRPSLDTTSIWMSPISNEVAHREDPYDLTESS
jgi:predicted GIY-YIG superfamily endonuclease